MCTGSPAFPSSTSSSSSFPPPSPLEGLGRRDDGALTLRRLTHNLSGGCSFFMLLPGNGRPTSADLDLVGATGCIAATGSSWRGGGGENGGGGRGVEREGGFILD